MSTDSELSSDMERRISTRYSTSVPMGIQFPEGDHKEGWGRILNISSTGLLLETRFPVKIGSILYISFIVRIGVQFEHLRARAVRVSFDEGYYIAGIIFDEVVDQETMKEIVTALAYEGGLTSSKDIKNY